MQWDLRALDQDVHEDFAAARMGSGLRKPYLMPPDDELRAFTGRVAAIEGAGD